MKNENDTNNCDEAHSPESSCEYFSTRVRQLAERWLIGLQMTGTKIFFNFF
ncbi:MAG TPA: hypothetical protein VIH86_14160 [Puia sp.]